VLTAYSYRCNCVVIGCATNSLTLLVQNFSVIIFDEASERLSLLEVGTVLTVKIIGHNVCNVCELAL
jgi:hypothetical protein